MRIQQKFKNKRKGGIQIEENTMLERQLFVFAEQNRMSSPKTTNPNKKKRIAFAKEFRSSRYT